MDFLELAKARYSCRKLTDRPIEQEKLDAIIAAGVAAPTAKNIQPVKIWLVKSADGAEKINSTTPCGYGAATFFVVGCRPDEAWVRDSDGHNFADVDGSIVATHLMLEIQEQGLGTTWVGWFDSPKLKSLFPQMEGYDLIAIFPVGYPAADAAPAPRHGERKPLGEFVETL